MNSKQYYPKEACGIFGVSNHPQAAELTYLGLYALQHRGQESAGMVSYNGERVHIYRNMGLVPEVFTTDILEKLKGEIAIGHVRYSTTGSSRIENAQPQFVNCAKGEIAIGHNGNLINAAELKEKLEIENGAIFQSTIDSEIFIQLIAKSNKNSVEDILMEVFPLVKGAYSLVIYWDKKVIAVRDPYGFRPLCLGKIDNSYVVASETAALDHIQADYVRDIEPGEILIIDRDQLKSVFPFKDHTERAFCIFEYIYFARPDSQIFGENVHRVRKKLGAQLAKEHPVDADYVISVPDSGNSAALGYSEESKIPIEMGFIRNHYIGRTFIQPTQMVRNLSVNIKLNPIRDLIQNKRIVVVDDSIVRGTTSRSRIEVLRKFGAKEVHLRISCPPHISGCYYGIDFPSSGELLAKKNTMEEIKKFLNVDSIGYLSIEGMLNCMGNDGNKFCSACFSQKYPLPIPKNHDKMVIEKNNKSSFVYKN